MSDTRPCELSIVVATSQGWQHSRPFLAHIFEHACGTRAEVVVADGSGLPPPDCHEMPGDVTWLALPGLAVFDLRLHAMRRARGAVVAVTEDHCRLAADWSTRMLEAHRRHPRAAAVKGRIINGSRDTAHDEAAFLMNQVPHMTPFHPGDAAHPGVACVSYKAAALRGLLAPADAVAPELLPAGGFPPDVVVMEPSVVAEHSQAVGFRGVSALQFHNARVITSRQRPQASSRDALRVIAAPVLPFSRAARSFRACRRKGVPLGLLAKCLPLFVWLYLCKGAGEVAGYLFGAGSSLSKL